MQHGLARGRSRRVYLQTSRQSLLILPIVSIFIYIINNYSLVFQLIYLHNFPLPFLFTNLDRQERNVRSCLSKFRPICIIFSFLFPENSFFFLFLFSASTFEQIRSLIFTRCP